MEVEEKEREGNSGEGTQRRDHEELEGEYKVKPQEIYIFRK